MLWSQGVGKHTYIVSSRGTVWDPDGHISVNQTNCRYGSSETYNEYFGNIADKLYHG